MLVQASTSRSTLASHQDAELVPHSPQLRRLLTRLDKAELVRLALGWLSASRAYHIPPKLSRRQPAKQADIADEATFRYHAVLDLNEERRARSLESLELIWAALMIDPKVPKTRAVERILTVDWVDGLSYGMVAEVDLLFGADRRTSRSWSAVKLVYDDARDSNDKGFDKLAPHQLHGRFSTELAHYFEHHIFLQVEDPSNGGRKAGDTSPVRAASTPWTSHFTYFRVVLAPSPADICAAGLHMLHIPKSPYLLLSGSLGRGSENREIALSALAQAAGAVTVNYPKPPPGSLQAKRIELDELGEDKAGNRRTLGELRGKDPIALREVLGILPARHASLLRVSSRANVSPSPTPPPAESNDKARQRITVKAESRREARELFGVRKGKDEDLPKFERIDYELYLGFPRHPPYKMPDMPTSSRDGGADGSTAVKLRLEGTHVLAGLRKLIEAGMDRETSYRPKVENGGGGDDDRSERTAEATRLAGLPGWLTEVRGTKVVVKPPGSQDEPADDTSGT
ncbi:uncharacterized protein PFL1_01379 [Pseudozyma flocculosa PF-1]|uniref:uncharacterized protein n=1 Tax=Pseudozyma flocculosa PF-1 TaxID=1277687 RepID=UPI0004561A80|nr:uncharacterized protein PFL1_01379 [Pseudozyma flocculosa PF-1]EPQ31191.1 hypothetical protein PFL1_01379 [Pseudozyma flocculosa PF-1]